MSDFLHWCALNDVSFIISPDQAIKALHRRLQDTDEKIVLLALTLTETCMKNCGQQFPSVINRSFMDDLVVAAKGNKGPRAQDEALRLIQQWGKTFQRNRSLPIFYDTYANLKARGASFPPDETAIAESQTPYVLILNNNRR